MTFGAASTWSGTRRGAARPLAGVVVLDLGQIVAGPTCAFFLASLGADVIRIERPGGDPSWGFGPYVGPDGQAHAAPAADRIPLTHLRRGRGKRSVTLDLKEPSGRAQLLQLARHADVLVENLRPGVLDRLGCGYEDLAATNPRLVWCSINGYGSDGPHADDPALDLTIQAQSGLMARTGAPDGPPWRVGAMVADQTAATFAALGVTAALHESRRTGRGTRVEVAMIDVLAAMLWDEPLDYYDEQALPVRNGNQDLRGAPFDLFEASDGRIAIVTTTEAQWQHLATIIGRPDLAQLRSPAARVARRDEIHAAIGAWSATRTRDEIEADLHAVGIPAGAVLAPIEAAAHERLAGRGLLERLVVNVEGAEPSRYVGPHLPVTFDGKYARAAPAEPLGLSTETVLARFGAG